MALDPAAAAAVAQQIVTILAVPPEARPKAEANWRAIIAAIYTGIQQNAVVVPTALLAPPGALGGPVTGVGSVT